MKKIELLLSGGLGNQMFQYAYARRVQLDHENCKLIINTSLYDTDRFDREFSLMRLILNEDIEIIHKSHSVIRLAGMLSKYYENLIYKIFSRFNICIWRSYNYRTLRDCNCIYGYFQSEKYFKKYDDLIKRELHVKSKTDLKNADVLMQIKSANSVCIHVRRGDYVTENLLVCDKAYYEAAIRYIRQKIENPVFFFFSDDIQWVKENFKNDGYIYVENNNQDYEELELMYNCKHFILSNSSFSWWAQYLSDNESKLVVAPKKWMPTKSVPDIYMDSWITI